MNREGVAQLIQRFGVATDTKLSLPLAADRCITNDRFCFFHIRAGGTSHLRHVWSPLMVLGSFGVIQLITTISH
jgi:hypothetical protein